MKRSAPVRAAAITIAVLTVFALTGCDDATDAVGASGPAAAVSAAEASEEDATEADAAEAELEDDVIEEPVEVVGGEECLHGNWYLYNESFQALLESAGGTVPEVTGWVVLTFHPDGTTSTIYDQWTTVATQDGSTATMVRNGEDHGTYGVDGDAIVMTETAGNSVVEMTIASGGEQGLTTTLEHEPSPVSNGSFACDAETLTVSAEGGITSFFREH